ncbi:NFAT activation molecule 1 [Rhinoderma darwinii]|uniref:NFAT activation molecule 1 n=1 Tax=Rhinoderma darwinii TaxID=43563 RepID=UPI003F67B92D
MENVAITILILGPYLTEACKLLSVTQNPPVLAALSGDQVKINCDVNLRADDTKTFHSFLHRAGGFIASSHNITETTAQNKTGISHVLIVTAPPAVYYCKVTCGTSLMKGTGTYIYVRDSGYAAPATASYKLCCALITLLILLLLLAASGTYLVIPISGIIGIISSKKNSSPPDRDSGPVARPSGSRSAAEDTGGSLYTSLEPARCEEVYDVLEDETSKTKELEGAKVRTISPTYSPRKG